MQQKGIRVDELVDFTVRGEVASEVQASIVGPEPASGQQPVKLQGQRTECIGSYLLRQPGVYSLNLTHKDKHIARSPFRVEVGPKSTSAAKAFGMGLYVAMADQPSYFHIIPDADPKQAVSIATVDSDGVMQTGKVEKQPDGSYQACYTATHAGEHAVHVMCGLQDIANSPWMVDVLPAANELPDVSKLQASGAGLGPQVPVSLPTQFTVDTQSTGVDAQLLLMCYDAKTGSPLEVKKDCEPDDKLLCSYLPAQPHLHILYATYGHVPLTGSPFKVQVVEPPPPVRFHLSLPFKDFLAFSLHPKSSIVD